MGILSELTMLVVWRDMIGIIGDLMPIRIETESPFLRIVAEGQITGADLVDLLGRVEHLEKGLQRIPDRVLDLSGVALDTNFRAMLELASRRVSRVFPNSFRSAIVAPTPATMGFARMFQTLNTNPQIELRIFDTRESAEAWLTNPSSP
jgi:hypothetical protein